MNKSVMFRYKTLNHWQRVNSSEEKFFFDMNTNTEDRLFLTKESYVRNQKVTETVNETNLLGPTKIKVFYEKSQQCVEHLGLVDKNHILPVTGNCYTIHCDQQQVTAKNNSHRTISDKEMSIVNRDYNYVNPDLWRELLCKKPLRIGSQLQLPIFFTKKIFYCFPWRITKGFLTLKAFDRIANSGVFSLVTQMEYCTLNGASLKIDLRGEIAVQITTCWLEYLTVQGQIEYQNCKGDVPLSGKGSLSVITTNTYF